MNNFHLLCTMAGNLSDAIELKEPRAAKLCIDDMRKLLDTIERENLPIPFKLAPVPIVKKGQHDAHVRARRRLIARIVDRAHERRLTGGAARDEVAKRAALGLSSFSSKPWPNWHAPGQKTVSTSVVHAAMCAGFLPRSLQGVAS